MSFLVKLILVVAVVGGVVGGFYYYASPYQICMRGFSDFKHTSEVEASLHCVKITNWQVKKE